MSEVASKRCAETPIARIPGVAGLLIVVLLGISSFSILLPLSPTWAISRGASEAAAGAVTTVLMAFTVLAQLSMSKAVKRLGWGPVFALGLAALGAPAMLQGLIPNYSSILISSAIRGIGFGILTVGGATVMAILVPPHRRGAAVGLYGLSVAAPQLILISSAPILAALLGDVAVTLIATAPLLGLLVIPSLRRTIPIPPSDHSSCAAHEVRDQGSTLLIIAPTLMVLFTVTCVGGALITFANQISRSAANAAGLLLCLTGFAALSRWSMGVLSDRRDALKLTGALCTTLVIGMLLLSMALFVAPSDAATLLLYFASMLLGVAYGGLQSTSLVYAFRLGGPSRITQVSVLWNVSFDIGTGVGALAVGGLASAAGFTFAFALLAGLSTVAAITAVIWLRARGTPAATTR